MCETREQPRVREPLAALDSAARRGADTRPRSRLSRLPWLTFLLGGLALLAHASPALSSALELRREALAAGEGWRIFTGHLTHFGRDHLQWDLAALLLLGALSESRDRRRFAGTLSLAACAIGTAVIVWQPQFSSYRGLSGLDSALFGLVCVDQITEGRRARHAFSVWLGGLALSGFALKCGFEILAGTTVFADPAQGAPYHPVPLAHLLGALIGIGCGAWTARARAGASD
jgi:rhomboid family GlyGly-CTERM serine protease